MSTEPIDMSDDLCVLSRRRALPGQGVRKAFLLTEIRFSDISITHFIIAYQSGDPAAVRKLELCKAERGAQVSALRLITKE